MLKEFKAFISKGNVLDLAVGLIMATYFGAIVKSMVDDLLMPIVGNLIGGIDFKEMKYVISEAVMDAEGVETAEQMQFFSEIKHCEVQGYYISKPIPEDLFVNWLIEYNENNHSSIAT